MGFNGGVLDYLLPPHQLLVPAVLHQPHQPLLLRLVHPHQLLVHRQLRHQHRLLVHRHQPVQVLVRQCKIKIWQHMHQT